MDKIALFTNIDRNYFSYAQRCFELFEKFNPGIFDFFIITSDPNPPNAPGINVITLNPNDFIKGFTNTGYPPESFLYYAAPGILNEKGYKYSMHVDADCVCLKKLDFSWLSEDFIVAGAPRMRNDLSEQIDAWYFLKAVNDDKTINFLEKTFELQNKNNIIDIQDGVMIIDNERWVNEGLYEKAYDLFVTCETAGYRMRDTDILSGLLMLDTPKSFYKHLTPSWNWYYERADVESMGGDDVNILHMAWVKPWALDNTGLNKNIERGLNLWRGSDKNVIHVVGTPGNPSNQDVTIDPFARVSYYLTTFLHRNGWSVEYHGYEESTVECGKKWGCVNSEWKEEMNIISDNQPPTTNNQIDIKYANAIKPSLESRVKKGDIVLFMWSTIIDHFSHLKDKGVKLVDAHIGHYLPSKSTSYHVYTSDSLRSWIYGKDNDLFNSKWHDAVIPPMAHSIDDYDYSTKKSNYFLFMSRLIEEKGLDVIIALANRFPQHKFKIAGPGNWTYWSNKVPNNVEYIGCLNGHDRKKYISNAKAIITPTIYFEPFGLTSVEAAISGTPIISTDWGGYTNNVLHGVTGFRCTHLTDFVNAIENIEKIESFDCRGWGEIHTAEHLIEKWNNYLIRIAKDSWYDEKDDNEIKKSFAK